VREHGASHAPYAMATVWIPSLLRDLTNGQETVQVSGANVREIIDALDRVYPGIKARLCDSNGLRRSLAVAVDAHVTRLGLLEPVAESSEVHFVPAISGGSAETSLP
jgi:sulfur-carrier protein